MERGLVPLPGVLGFLDAVGGRIPVGVASNSPRSLLDDTLRLSGLSGRFDVTVSFDEVDAPKPAPAVYLRVTEALGADPSRSVAFEDSRTGGSAAIGAGMHVVGVPSTPQGDIGAHCHVVSLADPALLAWARRLGERTGSAR